jgi:monoamine oxidase
MRNPRSVVVGAGYAGLAAATVLAERGVDVVVLEARDRVGGRVRSVPMPGGGFAEAGGEWIFEGYDRVRALAERVGSGLVAGDVDFLRREADGVTLAEQDAFCRSAERELRSSPRERVADLDVASFLAEVPGEDLARRAVAARLQGTCAVELDRVAVAALGAEAFAESAGPAWRLDEGNQALAERLADRLPEVRLGSRVSDVSWSASSVRVTGTTTRGDEVVVEADGVVVAVPLPLLRTIRWAPGLPVDVLRAIEAIPAGAAAKLVVPLDGPVAPRARQSVTEPFWWWTTSGADGRTRPWVTAFAGSRTALHALDTASGDPARWAERLLALDPDLRPLGEAVMTDWAADPFACGAYVAISPAALRRLGALAEPFGAVALAGEHAAGVRWHGTMEGAVRSGERAATALAGWIAG